MTRVLALDYGAARCGTAVSDPTGSVVTPLEVIERPESPAGMEALVALVRRTGAEVVVVGLPLTLRGHAGAQAAAAGSFAGRLRRAAGVPVELHDERLTTRQAAASPGRSGEDSRAAAHLLEDWLRATTEARA